MSDQEHPPPTGEPPVPPPSSATPPGSVPPRAGMPPPGSPAGGPPPGQDVTQPLPWEERQSGGFLKSLIDTAALFVQGPRQAFLRARTRGDYASPLLWMLIFVTIGAAFRALWRTLFFTSFLSFMPREMIDQMGPFMTFIAGAGTVVTFFSTIVISFIAFFVYALILHLSLLLFGGGKDSPSGFEGTFRAVCYPQVALVAQVIPFAGSLIALVWCVIMQIIGISAMHRITGGKAFVVWLAPLFLCCACISIAMAFGAAAFFSGLGHGH